MRVDSSAFRRDLHEIRDRIAQAAEDAIADALRSAELVAKDRAAAQTVRRTGALLRGIGSSHSGPRGKLFAKAPHSEFIEEGTSAHVIAARNAPLLKFRIAGRWVAKKTVQHPGTKPRPFMAPASKRGEDMLRASLEQRVGAATRG